jgi:hypothetical protein
MRPFSSGVLVGFFGFVALLAVHLLGAQTPVVAIDNDDVGGVVRGPGGPEIGIWVIAGTRELGTRFAGMVVTDGRGRYAVPDLPNAADKGSKPMAVHPQSPAGPVGEVRGGAAAWRG